jgi:hypothetical protein
MKRILTAAPALLVLVCIIMVVQTAPGAADEWGARHHYWHHHYARLAYANYTGYGACRVGWWQTLRYGHVRPVWASWCR